MATRTNAESFLHYGFDEELAFTAEELIETLTARWLEFRKGEGIYPSLESLPATQALKSSMEIDMKPFEDVGVEVEFAKPEAAPLFEAFCAEHASALVYDVACVEGEWKAIIDLEEQRDHDEDDTSYLAALIRGAMKSGTIDVAPCPTYEERKAAEFLREGMSAGDEINFIANTTVVEDTDAFFTVSVKDISPALSDSFYHENGLLVMTLNHDFKYTGAFRSFDEEPNQ